MAGIVVDRNALLAKLQQVRCAVTSSDVIDQSSCFVFHKGKVIAFNGMMRAMAPVEGPDGFAVQAANLINLLDKFGDAQVDLEYKSGELVVSGKSKAAGLVCQTDVELPHQQVEKPGKWSKLAEGTDRLLLQAARTCSKDYEQAFTNLVHVRPGDRGEPDVIEACDNFRYFHAAVDSTGFAQEVCIAADWMRVAASQGIDQVSIGQGWIHFRNPDKTVFSIRQSEGKYREGLDELLNVQGQEVELPKSAVEMIERASVVAGTEHYNRVQVRLLKSKVVVSARTESGWFREHTKVEYGGPKMVFSAHPYVLADLISHALKVVVDKSRLKASVPPISYVVAIQPADDEG